MNRLRILMPAVLLVAAMVASSQPADARHGARLVATIHGAGFAMMDAGGQIRGNTRFSIDAKLYSDGTATGFVDCEDFGGSLWNGRPADGDVYGPFTSWKKVNGKIALIGTLQLRGDPSGAVFGTIVTIQEFGGAGKGHWTMSVPDFEAGGPPICSESITSGRVDLRQYDWQD